MFIKKIIKGRKSVLLNIFIIIGLMTGLSGCMEDANNDSERDVGEVKFLVESEFFNDSHIFSEGVYMGYEEEYDYELNITNNTDTLHLNYTFQYRFEEPLIGPAGQLTLTWTFHNDDDTQDSFILHQIQTDTTTEENGTIVYHDDYLQGIENQTGSISVRINGNGSDNTLTGGSEDFFTLSSEVTQQSIVNVIR